MEAPLLTRYFLLVHLAFTLINGHPILDSFYILGNGTVHFDLRATKDQRDSKETQFLLKTKLNVEDLRNIVQIIIERHRHTLIIDYVTSIHRKNFVHRENYADKNDEDLVSNSEYSQLPLEHIKNSRRRNRTKKNRSTGNSYKEEVHSGKMKRSSSLPNSYRDGIFLNKINERLGNDEKSDQIQNDRRADESWKTLEVTLIDEIYNSIRETLSLFETRPERNKKVMEDFSNSNEEDSKRDGVDYHNNVKDGLLNLYLDTRILYWEILKDLVLRNEREKMELNDRSLSYDDWDSPKPSFKHDSSDSYYLQNFVDSFKRNQKLDNPTGYDEITAKKICEDSKRYNTQLENDTTGTLKVELVKSAYEEPINHMYKQDVAANEIAVRSGFDYIWNFANKKSNEKSNFDNSTLNNSLVSKEHSSHHQDDSKGDAKFSKELENNIKNASVTYNNKIGEDNSIMKNIPEDTEHFFRITTETSNKEITEAEDMEDSNGENASFSLLPNIDRTADEDDDTKNTTVIRIKDKSNNVIKNLTVTNEFIKPPNPTVATTNTKQNASFLIQNEQSKESKANNKQNQFVMDHILDAVDKVLLFD